MKTILYKRENGKKYRIPDVIAKNFETEFPDAVRVTEQTEAVQPTVEQPTMPSPELQPQLLTQQKIQPQSIIQPIVEQPTTSQGRENYFMQSPTSGGNMVWDADEERFVANQEGLQGRYRPKPTKVVFNPQTRRIEQQYITPAGNVTTDKAAADFESQQWRNEYDVSLSGRLDRANDELKMLEEQLRARRDALLERSRKNQISSGIMAFAQGLQSAEMGGQINIPGMDDVINDSEYRTLFAAVRQKKDQIQMLQNKIAADSDPDNLWGDTQRFFRHFGQAVADIDSWDLGINQLNDASQMLRINNKIERGEELTETEQALMENLLLTQSMEQQIGDLGDAATWGNIGGTSLSLMTDFILTGGYSGVAKGLTKRAVTAIARKGTNKLATELAEEGLWKYATKNGIKGVRNQMSGLVAEQGLGRTASMLATRTVGVTAEDLLIRAPLMATTIQGGRLAGDIIDTKLGPVEVDEANGELRFANDHTWGEAAWEATADRVIENMSEMAGGHFLGVDDVTKAFGANAIVSRFLRATPQGIKNAYAKTSQFLQKAGVQSITGEVAEEYVGQLWRTGLGLESASQPVFDANGNPVYETDSEGNILKDENGEPIQKRENNLLSGEFHKDIWCGMALSVGLTQYSGTALNYGTDKAIGAIAQARQRHNLKIASTKAGELFGTDVWESMRAIIDTSENDAVADYAEQIINDDEMTDEQQSAVLNYMEQTLVMRGINLGALTANRIGMRNVQERRFGRSWGHGYEAVNAEERSDIQAMYDYQRQRVLDYFGGKSEIIDDLDNDPVGAITDRVGQDKETQQIVADYINSKMVYDGMMQRAKDEIDERITQSNVMIDSRTNPTTGMVQGATMKQDDRKVYVVLGNVAMHPDGSDVDTTSSDDSIVIKDAETGKTEMVSPNTILNVDEPLDANEQKAIAAENIRTEIETMIDSQLRGLLNFTAGEVYEVAQEDGSVVAMTAIANEQGIIDNGDGTINVQFADGSVGTMNKEVLQASADAKRKQRVVDMARQIEEERKAKANSTEVAEEEPTDDISNENPLRSKTKYSQQRRVELLDENGNVVSGRIALASEDGYTIDLDGDYAINNDRSPVFSEEELTERLVSYDGKAVNKEKKRSAADATLFDQRITDEMNGNLVSSDNTSDGKDSQNSETTQGIKPSALERVPKDAQGNPMYTQTDAETAWDAIVEEAEGDTEIAAAAVSSMVADMEAALKKAEKAKSKGGVTMKEKMDAERERKAAINAARQQLEAWQAIASVPTSRQQAAEAEQKRIEEERLQAERAAEQQRKAEEAKLRAEREEAERIEREALNGVPDMVDDTPQDARARGYRRVSGHKIDRQEPVQGLQGKEIAVKFSDNTIPTGRVAVIEAEQLQPSHIGGQRNPLHFIDEAQPKERNDEASVLSARKIAGNIRPEEITSSVTAYTGAPTVNARGEAIQGNSRSDALRQMWESHPEQSAKYKQYLTDHAQEFGLNAEDIAGMQHPVLVNMLDVEDADAITLGQYVAQDTESGGTERIKPKNALQRMGADIRTFANLLLKSSDEETSFAGLVDNNGVDVLKWMSQRGFITPTQYKSAFDSKGNLTAEAKNDLRGIMYQSIFKGGSTRLEEMFNAMPAKAQKAILATAFRDYDSPSAERMIEEIQNSIRAYYALSQDAAFVEAKTFKEARMAAEGWKIQYQIDDVTGDSYLPAENFSNFALLLATMYKGENQSIIQGTFNKLYDLIQGTQEENLFEQPDNTPRTLAQAIKETLNITYNGQRRSNVLVGDSSASQRGQQGSTGNAATGERVEDGERTVDSAGSIESDSRQGRTSETYSVSQEKEINHLDPRTMSEEEKQRRGDMLRNAPAIDVKKEVITSTPELSARKAAEKWWDENVNEPALYDTEAGEVEINRNSIESSLAHRYGQKKLDAITSLIEGFENAVYLGSMEDGTRQEGVLNHYFAFPIMYDGELSYVFCRAMQDSNKNRLYVHEVFVGNKIKKGDTLQTAAFQPHGGISLYRDILANVLETEEKSGISPTEPNGEPTVSDSKDTTNSPTTNELDEKNAVSSVQQQVEAAESPTTSHDTDQVSDQVSEERSGLNGEIAMYQQDQLGYGETLTPAQQLATEAALTALNRSGIEVVEADDAMTEAVLQQSGAEMSKRSIERAETNRVIDEAISFVTGKSVKEVRQNRIKREAERKELAKEIFENVLSGNLNEVILQKINQYIDETTPRNPYGRRLSQRLPQRVEREMYEKQRNNAVDALYSRISESSVPANGRFSESGRRKIESRKKELLKAWAIATNNWYTDISGLVSSETPIGRGTDSIVYTSKEGNSVIKLSKGKPFDKRFRPDIDNIPLFNSVFKNSAYEIIGYGEINGEFVRILKQPIVDFSESTPLSEEDRVEYMQSLGFSPLNKENTAFSNGEIVISDLQKSNIVRDKFGEIRVIDADAKLHTKDVGGDYEYLPVEYDLPSENEAKTEAVHGEQKVMFMSVSEARRRAEEIKSLKPIEVVGNTKTKEELKEDYINLPNVVKGGNLIQFYRSAFKKIYKEGGLFAQIIPQLDKILEQSVLAYSETDNLGGTVRADGSVHKAHPNVKSFDNFVGKVKIDGKEYYVRTTIQEENSGLSGTHSYIVTEVSLYENTDNDLSLPITTRARGINAGIVDAKLQQFFEYANGKAENAPQILRTPSGTVYGWTVGGKVYLTRQGMNPNTPVHEYTHLWANAMMQKNSEGWNSIKELLRGTPVWEEVMSDTNYSDIHDNEDLVASEVLSRLSGTANAEKLEQMAQQMLDKANGVFEKAEAVTLIERIKDALRKFWSWVGKNLFDIKSFDSIEEVTDRVLWDLMNGTDLQSEVKNSDVVEAQVINKNSKGAKSDDVLYRTSETPLNPDDVVNVEHAEPHDFNNFNEAKQWAKENIVRTYSNEETAGKGEIRISNNAVSKYLSESAVEKSDDKDVHLSVLKVLPSVIRSSVDAEQHPDYNKGEDGKRRPENGINEDVNIHRLYGAVELNGEVYRVKITLKEDFSSNEAKAPHSYEATKIELLAGTLVKPESGPNPNTNNSISLAKLTIISGKI